MSSLALQVKVGLRASKFPLHNPKKTNKKKKKEKPKNFSIFNFNFNFKIEMECQKKFLDIEKLSKIDKKLQNYFLEKFKCCQDSTFYSFPCFWVPFLRCILRFSATNLP